MADTQIEITPQELKMLPQDSYQLIDTRDDASIAYGMANGAIHIPQEAVVDRLTSEPELLKGRTAILYCARGILSMELASELNRRGIPSRSLTGGYNGWLLAHLAGDTPDESEEEKEEARLARQKRIEDSIRRKFHVPLFSRFAKAVRDYELIQENDKIAVCISGGKDSMLMAKLFQELKRHNKFPFEVVYLVMDPGYNAANRKIIEENARMLGIPATIFDNYHYKRINAKTRSDQPRLEKFPRHVGDEKQHTIARCLCIASLQYKEKRDREQNRPCPDKGQCIQKPRSNA